MTGLDSFSVFSEMCHRYTVDGCCLFLLFRCSTAPGTARVSALLWVVQSCYVSRLQHFPSSRAQGGTQHTAPSEYCTPHGIIHFSGGHRASFSTFYFSILYFPIFYFSIYLFIFYVCVLRNRKGAWAGRCRWRWRRRWRRRWSCCAGWRTGSGTPGSPSQRRRGPRSELTGPATVPFNISSKKIHAENCNKF